MKPRNGYEIKLIRESGRITALALKKTLASIKEGITGLELNRIAEDEIKRLGGDLAFLKVKDYKWGTCITVNEAVVHGIPTNDPLKKGDLVSIDLGSIFKGWFSDAAWSMVVGEVDQSKIKFLKVGEEALWDGIAQAKDASRIGDIGHAIQSKLEGAGYSVVRSLVGHGIGKQLHLDPEVPGYGQKNTGSVLKKGMTLAIEVIYLQKSPAYNQGSPGVVLGDDNWTIFSADRSLAGLFEMSIIVGDQKAEVITDWRSV